MIGLLGNLVLILVIFVLLVCFYLLCWFGVV